MRGLTVCISIVCLAFASGAPSDKKSKVYTKNFNYDNKDVIYSFIPFFKDELVYAVCEGSTDEKKCKVYIDSANQDENIVHSCDVNLKYTGRFQFQLSLFNAGNSRAVIVIRDGVTKFNVFSVNLKGCHIAKEVSFVGERHHPEYREQLHVEFGAHESNYDIFFPNKELCQDFLCKATIDYEGKIVKAASEFPIKYDISVVYRIASAGDAYVIGKSGSNESNVYLVKDGDNKPNQLYSGPSGFIILSTEENKLGFCTHAQWKTVCSQYDAKGRNKLIEISYPTGEDRLDSMEMLNLEKGFLVVTVETTRKSVNRVMFIVHYDEQGKQGKHVNLSFDCNKNLILVPKLYKNSNGQYCVTSICLQPIDSGENKSVFSRNTRCFLNSELF